MKVVRSACLYAQCTRTYSDAHRLGSKENRFWKIAKLQRKSFAVAKDEPTGESHKLSK